MISIIVPTLNAQLYIRRALDSLLLQTYADIEIIIIDGGSRDNTVNIVKSVIDPRISLVQSTMGIYASINIGITMSSKPWIYIMGADDYLWSKCVLSRVVARLPKEEDRFRIVYGSVAYVNHAGTTLQKLGVPWECCKSEFKSRMVIPHQGVFHHRDLFKFHGLFDESFNYAGDYELLLRELINSDPFWLYDITVAAYQHGGGSSVPRNAIRVWREYRKAQLKNGIIFPSFDFLIRYSRTAIRVLAWRILGDRLGGRVDDFFRGLVGLPKIWTRSQAPLPASDCAEADR